MNPLSPVLSHITRHLNEMFLHWHVKIFDRKANGWMIDRSNYSLIVTLLCNAVAVKNWLLPLLSTLTAVDNIYPIRDKRDFEIGKFLKSVSVARQIGCLLEYSVLFNFSSCISRPFVASKAVIVFHSPFSLLFTKGKVSRSESFPKW